MLGLLTSVLAVVVSSLNRVEGGRYRGTFLGDGMRNEPSLSGCAVLRAIFAPRNICYFTS